MVAYILDWGREWGPPANDRYVSYICRGPSGWHESGRCKYRDDATSIYDSCTCQTVWDTAQRDADLILWNDAATCTECAHVRIAESGATGETVISFSVNPTREYLASQLRERP